MNATTSFRDIGGTVMMAVPSSFMAQMGVEVGTSIRLELQGNTLLVNPVFESQSPLRYTLDELLVQSDYSQPLPPEEREWVDAPRAGRELI